MICTMLWGVFLVSVRFSTPIGVRLELGVEDGRVARFMALRAEQAETRTDRR